MATFTLLEFSALAPNGEPLYPYARRQTALAFATAHEIGAETVFFRVIPDVDARLRVSDDGAAATSADPRVYADVGTDCYVQHKAAPQIYLISA